MEKKIRMQVPIPTNLYNQLRIQAATEGLSLWSYVRKVLVLAVEAR